jgi:putative flavoprotein involved in K+ transport
VVERLPLVIIGAGHAGLSLSHELTAAGVEHVILERGRVAQSWRSRWDSFCLVTPNWTVRLPGGAYDGDDPDGFMPRDRIVEHMEHYATGFGAPVREGVAVTSVQPYEDGGFLMDTSAGQIRADALALASGAYQKPFRPPGASDLPDSMHVIDAEGYRSPEALPPGRVLVVGSGQTGCQIAEELHEADRDVVLASGRAPWVPRRLEGRDIVKWMAQTSFMHHTAADLPSPMARLVSNLLVSGQGGGHDLNWRTLQAAGVTLAGHFRGVEGDNIVFAPDLAESVAFGDARYAELRPFLQESAAKLGVEVPQLPEPAPFVADPPERISARDIDVVIFTCGFRPDFTRWVHLPDAFDDMGFPIATDGQSTNVPGLFFIGTHFLRKRKSATLFGIEEDAPIVAERIAATRH